MKPLRTMAVVTILMFMTAQAATALELKPGTTPPSDYAKSVETTNTEGKPVTQFAFGTSPSTVSPHQLNAILTAYGVAIKDLSKAPAWYATEVSTVDKDGKTVKEYAFPSSPTVLSTQDLHHILTAYGISLADLTKAPEGYAREVETQDAEGKAVKTHAFGTMPRTFSATELNDILQAYR